MKKFKKKTAGTEVGSPITLSKLEAAKILLEMEFEDKKNCLSYWALHKAAEGLIDGVTQEDIQKEYEKHMAGKENLWVFATVGIVNEKNWRDYIRKAGIVDISEASAVSILRNMQKKEKDKGTKWCVALSMGIQAIFGDVEFNERWTETDAVCGAEWGVETILENGKVVKVQFPEQIYPFHKRSREAKVWAKRWLYWHERHVRLYYLIPFVALGFSVVMLIAVIISAICCR